MPFGGAPATRDRGIASDRSGYTRHIDTPSLPTARGRCTDALLTGLRRAPHDLGPFVAPDDEPCDGDDFHLALHVCHELHYRGFERVDPRWEWEPSLVAWRNALEDGFAVALRADIDDRGDARDVLRALARDDGGPSLSAELLRAGDIEHLREFAIHRSAYQLKEADPHTWVIPRLTGRAKAAVVRIQTGEYGDGSAVAMHSSLFTQTMAALGLDPTYGAYVDVLPGTTLATGNLISMFGLQRRWRGALVGHLALFEMTSTRPMARYSEALRRLGLPLAARRFYDVHVEADVVHERIAIDELVPGLLADEPDLERDVVFGAYALTAVERRFADALRDAWSRGTTSLLAAVTPAAA